MKTFNNRYEQLVNENILDEGLRNKILGTAAAGVVALSPMSKVEGSNSPKAEQRVEQKEEQKQTPDIRNAITLARYILEKYEGNVPYVYDDADKTKPRRRWEDSDKQGNPTIGIGHLVTDDEMKKYLGKTLDKDDINELFDEDIQKHVKSTQNMFPDFGTYPVDVQAALINAVYRGEMKSNHETVKAAKRNDWLGVMNNYLDRTDYRLARDGKKNTGIKKRMDANARVFAMYYNKLRTKQKRNK